MSIMLTYIQTEGNKIVFNIESYNMPRVRTNGLVSKDLRLISSPHALPKCEDADENISVKFLSKKISVTYPVWLYCPWKSIR
jgi:hypothetical protein